MKGLRSAALLGAGVLITAAGPAEALTIYRIGGADLPPPALSGQAGVTFVQLDWSAVGEAPLVAASQMDVNPAFLEPALLASDVNLAVGFREKLGVIRALDWMGWTLSPVDDDVMWDGDTTTVFLGDGAWTAHGRLWREILFDFDGIFMLDRVKFFPRERHLADRFMESFRIGINDGDPLKDGTREVNIGTRGSYIDFDIVHTVLENSEGVVELKLPALPVQKLFFEFHENKGGIWEIAELEIYGGGRAPRASYDSPVIDLGRPVTLGTLTWGGTQEEGARVDLALRSGDDVDPNLYWRRTFRGDEVSRYSAAGTPLRLNTYNRLKSSEQGGITHDTENWSFWSTAYEFDEAAAAIAASRPRRYVQFRIGIESTLDATGRLDFVQFEVSDPPIASSTVAEISPTAVPPGESSSFTYKLLPVVKADDLGFDHIEISTPIKADTVDAVRMGGVEVAFQIVRMDSAGFELRIPRVDMARTHELIEIDFRARIFKYGTVFSGRVFDGDRPLEVRQVVGVGDADVLDDSNTLAVALSQVGQSTLNTLRLEPRVFTPNGDGVNDRLRIEAELLNLVGDVPLRVDLFDLAGRRVFKIRRDVVASGRYIREWDGLDAKGRLVPPGIYLLRVEVEADRRVESISRTVSVAY